MPAPSGETDGERAVSGRLAFSPQVMAYVGDAVYELYVREKAVRRRGGLPVRRLHGKVVALVRGEAQMEALQRIEPLLTPEERDVARRGRNVAVASSSGAPAVRCASTAFETLVGYLYLEGRRERLEELLDPVVEDQLARETARARVSP